MGKLVKFDMAARQADIKAREIVENYKYPFVVREINTTDEAGWLAEVPLLPGCFVNVGDDEFYLLPDLVKDAIYYWAYNAALDGRDIPVPQEETPNDHDDASHLASEFFYLITHSDDKPE